MSENETNSKVNDTINAVTGLVQAVPIYQDAVQPAAKEVGKGLEIVVKAINVALEPVRGLVWGYEKIKDYINVELPNRLKNVDPDKIITPQPNVAVPTLEAMRYTGHIDELRELFTNLLASSMNSDSAKEAFPSFVEIIKQMTPDEAKLLDYLVKNQIRPVINLMKQYKDTGGSSAVLTNYSHFGKASECQYPELTPAYLTNLCRLGILDIPIFGQYTEDHVYKSLASDPIVKLNIEKIESHPNVTAGIEKKVVNITDFGWKFVDTCVIRKTPFPVDNDLS